MKILITGAHGQLAQTIMNSIHAQEHELIFTARTVGPTADSDARFPLGELDITDAESVLEMVSDNEIEVIINCAGYTNVPKAETESEAAFKANAEGVSNLAKAAKVNDALLVHISTDYVFDGKSATPYKETDRTSPLNEYGRSKLAGDEAVMNEGCRYLIFRISWLFSPYGNNFLKTILKKSKELPAISVVNDQTGTPTYAGDLADAIFTAIEETQKATQEANQKTPDEAQVQTPVASTGDIYNYSNEGQCTWYEFAKEICARTSADCKVTPCRTEDYPTNVERPRYSVLDKGKFKSTFGKSIPHWKDALARCLKQTNQKA